MSRSLNRALIIGHLGNDPEIRTTPSGVKVAQFSVATTRRWTDANGESSEKTQWHRIVAWERLAATAEQFLKKGDRIHVEGEIEYRSYEPRDNSGTRYITEIRARDFIMLGNNGREADTDVRTSAPRSRNTSRPAERASTSARGSTRSRATAGAARSNSPYDDFKMPDNEDDDGLPF
jgi:single-strand DNA-binding protein